MNDTITTHIDQFINQVSPVLKDYKFTFHHDGMNKEMTCRGVNAADARKSITAYFGEVEEYGCKEL